MLELIEDLGMLYPTETSKRKYRYGLYKCICGKQFKSQVANITRENTKSCGCYNKQRVRENNILINTSHNLSKHRLYGTWIDMMRRCYNKNNKAYKNYGAIGVSVCKEWHNIKNFISDMNDTFKIGLTLDKDTICREKGISPAIYSKDTCIWATKSVQNRITRKIRSNNKTGYRGVCWDKQAKKHKAQITVNNKHINLGYFNEAIVAAKTYDNYVIQNNLEHTINFN